MQLTSFTFLFAFLPVSLLFLLLLSFLAGLLETLAVYALALILARADRPKARKMVFTLGVLFCVGLLCYFKYTNFLLGALSLPTVSLLPAPLGVSFLTFLLISYLADVYRGEIPALTGFFSTRSFSRRRRRGRFAGTANFPRNWIRARLRRTA